MSVGMVKRLVDNKFSTAIACASDMYEEYITRWLVPGWLVLLD